MKKLITLTFLVLSICTVYGQSDAGITAVLHPGANICSGDSIKVKIKNFGVAAISNIPVEVRITGVITATINNVYSASLAAGAEDSINVGALVSGTTGFIIVRAYTTLAGDANLANDSFQIFSNIAASPNVNAYASDSVCVGIAFALSANGANSYLWSGGTIVTPTTANPYVQSVATPGTYTYQVIGTNSVGCKDTATKTVKINPLPVVSTVGDTICPGEVGQVSASGGVSYNWGALGTGATVNATPSVTTSYTVTVTSFQNCTATGSANVMVRFKPVISVQNDSICFGEIAVLKAFGGVAYNWGTFGTKDTIAVSPSTTTNYSVTVTDAFNCTNSTNAVAYIRPNPTIICLVDSLCQGQTARIDAKGAFFYNWGSLGTNSYVFVSPAVNTNYSVTGTDIYGCTGVGTASVILKPGVTVSAVGDTACMGEDVTVSVSNPQAQYSYNWGTLGSGASLTFKSTKTNSYTVMATGPNGCTAEAIAFVLVENKPSLNIGINKNVLCLGESAMLLAGIPSGGIMSGKGVFNSMMFPDSAGIGTHSIKYIYSTPNAGCTDSFTRNIKVAKCTNEIESALGIEKVVTFPNPFDNILQVSMKASAEGRASLTLLDLSGRVMGKKEIQINPTADNLVFFETENLASGLYQVRILKNDEIHVFSVLKQ